MSYRRIAASAAVLAAGISLVPGLAHAADPSTGKAHGVTTPGLSKAAAPKFTDFNSPAVQGKTAAPQAPSTGANPTLAVGLHAVTTSAHGLKLDTAITSADAPLTISIAWGDNTTSQERAAGTQTVTTPHTYAHVGTYTIKVTVVDQNTQAVVSNEVVVTTEGSDYTPYGPTRLLDTRNGTGAAQAKVAPYTATHLKIAGNGNIPAGVTAVALNVTVTNTASGGHITAYAGGGQRPSTSNVNFVPGQTVPNLTIVPVSKDGYVDLYNGGWESVDLIADVTGYFTQSASSGYTPLNPARIVDTRSGLGTAQGQVAGQTSFGVQISGQGGVNPGATAVALNVTVTNPRQDGHLTVYPGGQQAPTASNVNFTADQTIANSVIVPVGPDGKINVRNGAWAGIDVIVDVVGYYSPYSASAYVPVRPTRLLDTRDSADWADGPLGGRGYIYMPLASGYPHTKGFVLNSTVTNTRDSGFLAVTPDPYTKEQYENGTAGWPATPTSSTLNWTTGKTVPNLVQAGVGYTGIIDFWNQSDGDIDLIVDLFGVYEDN
ncbi:hypothetical protein ABZZ20_21850 [Streptomyces sp. NPDC006430]|uniref:hypothetical protein n=1 Tax=Streptomyces sp. NPDC006430 TaxID=3154299 RepID=UPI0033B5E1D1